MKKAINTRVAYIIDNRTLVLSSGSQSGVTNGIIFKIMSEKRTPIIDPETKKQLGELDNEKLRVKVISTEVEFSIAETFEYTTVNKGGYYNTSLSTLGQFFEVPKLEKHYKTFNISDQDKREISEKDSIVRIGDRAEEITTDM